MHESGRVQCSERGGVSVRPSAVGDSGVELGRRIRTTRDVVDRVVVAVTRVQGQADVVDVVPIGRFDAFGRE